MCGEQRIQHFADHALARTAQGQVLSFAFNRGSLVTCPDRFDWNLPVRCIT